MKSKVLNPSIGVKNARFGSGQYFTDIVPGAFTKGQTSYRLYGVPLFEMFRRACRSENKLAFIILSFYGLDTIAIVCKWEGRDTHLQQRNVQALVSIA